MDTVKHEHI